MHELVTSLFDSDFITLAFSAGLGTHTPAHIFEKTFECVLVWLSILKKRIAKFASSAV